MSNPKNKGIRWMISPKSFISLLGAEYSILKDAGGTVLLRFYISALLIVCVSVISFLSIEYAIDLLFHMIWLQVSLSLFISLLFLLIYVFLINTFTKEEKNSRLLTFSNIIRIGFIIFMGFLLSKPIEIYYMENKLVGLVEAHKEFLFREHENKTSAIFENDYNKLEIRRQNLITLNYLTKDSIYQKDIELLNVKINDIQSKKDELSNAAANTIQNSNFFIYRVSKTVRSPFSWLICVGVIVLFLVPGYMIYSISSDSRYFILKKQQERTMILAVYNSFLEKYRSIFQEKFGVQVQLYTAYADPPFNKKRKPDPSYNHLNSFFSKYFR